MLSSSLQWFPRARLPEPGTGGGGGAGSPVWAGGVPAPPCLPGQHLHHNCRLILLLSADACHLPGLLLYPELWEFFWLPVTWAPGSPGSPGLPQDGRWPDGSRDGGDQDGQQRRRQFPGGVRWRAAAAGQGAGFHYHRMIQVFCSPSCHMGIRVGTGTCEAVKSAIDFRCLDVFHTQHRGTIWVVCTKPNPAKLIIEFFGFFLQLYCHFPKPDQVVTTGILAPYQVWDQSTLKLCSELCLWPRRAWKQCLSSEVVCLIVFFPIWLECSRSPSCFSRLDVC